MNKPLKVVLITAAAFIVAGLALGVGVLASVGFDIRKVGNDTPYQKNTYAPTQSTYESVVIKGNATDVDIAAAQGTGFEITTYTNDYREVSIEDENGVLTVTCTEKGSPSHGFIDFSTENPTTLVEVPSSFTGTLSLESTSGAISVSDLSGNNDLQASAANGSIRAIGCELGNVSFDSSGGDFDMTSVQVSGTVTGKTQSGYISLRDCSLSTAASLTTSSGSVSLNGVSTPDAIAGSAQSGSIFLNGCNLGAATLETLSGDIHVEDARIAGALRMNTQSGSSEFVDVSAASIECAAASGEVKAHRIKTAALVAETSNGEIYLESIESDSLTAKSSSGGISGEIKGYAADYAIACSSSSGNVTVRDESGNVIGFPRITQGSKLLSLTTTNGNIDMDFSVDENDREPDLASDHGRDSAHEYE